MSKIKFKAWNHKNKILLDFNYIVRNKEILQSVIGAEEYKCFPSKQVWDVMLATIHKDKHGNTIYEKDIIRDTDNSKLYIVKKNKTYGFHYADNIHKEADGINLLWRNTEIVGNKYTTPHLLEDTEYK